MITTKEEAYPHLARGMVLRVSKGAFALVEGIAFGGRTSIVDKYNNETRQWEGSIALPRPAVDVEPKLGAFLASLSSLHKLTEERTEYDVLGWRDRNIDGDGVELYANCCPIDLLAELRLGPWSEAAA